MQIKRKCRNYKALTKSDLTRETLVAVSYRSSVITYQILLIATSKVIAGRPASSSKQINKKCEFVAYLRAPTFYCRFHKRLETSLTVIHFCRLQRSARLARTRYIASIQSSDVLRTPDALAASRLDRYPMFRGSF